MTQNKVLTAISDAGRPIMVDLLALAGSSLLTLASAVEPLRAANRQSGRTVFDWRFVSVNGDAPITSSGIAWPVSGRHDPASRCDVLASGRIWRGANDRPRLIGHIYRAARNATIVMGIESGPWLLARAGCLMNIALQPTGKISRTSPQPFRMSI
jgi:transcriptional regulator GlxA family with amidase domain